MQQCLVLHQHYTSNCSSIVLACRYWFLGWSPTWSYLVTRLHLWSYLVTRLHLVLVIIIHRDLVHWSLFLLYQRKVWWYYRLYKCYSMLLIIPTNACSPLFGQWWLMPWLMFKLNLGMSFWDQKDNIGIKLNLWQPVMWKWPFSFMQVKKNKCVLN